MLTFFFTLSINRKWISSHAHTIRKPLTFHFHFRRDVFICTKCATVHVRNYNKDCSSPVIVKMPLVFPVAFFHGTVWASKCSHTSQRHAHTKIQTVLSFACRQQWNGCRKNAWRQHLTQLDRHYNTFLLSIEPSWDQVSWAVACYSLVFNIAGNKIRARHGQQCESLPGSGKPWCVTSTNQLGWHRVRQVVYRWEVCLGHKQWIQSSTQCYKSETTKDSLMLVLRWQRKPASIESTICRNDDKQKHITGRESPTAVFNYIMLSGRKEINVW